MQHIPSLRIAVDIGGTFTDIAVMDGGAVIASAKVLTTHNAPAEAAFDGAQSALARVGRSFEEVAGFIHGTTLATNALIERRGAKVACVLTEGFGDILEIAYERRHSQYDINLIKTEPIVPRSRCFTIGGRIMPDGHAHAPLDRAGLQPLADQIAQSGAEAVAVCLLHAYANPAHERAIAEHLRASLPGVPVSLSSDVSPEAREYDRLCTTACNAYVQPLMAGYLNDLETRFRAAGMSAPILMMTASGGMTTLETAAALPIRLVESGPAGGAILAARIARQAGLANVLSLDIGGTTAKLCLIDNGAPQTSRQFEIARAARFVKGSGIPVRIPVIDMIEIGAGGGSIAAVDGMGRLSVGPHSAGSDPGPAAFAKGGEHPTVTDADVHQGLLQPDGFAEGRLAIDPALSTAAIATHIGAPLAIPDDAAAHGISAIVDENMAAAARVHAIESGKNIAARTLIAFGGNGPLHATRVADRAGIKQILIPPDPGVGSAIGFLHAPVSFERVRSFHTRLANLPIADVNALLDEMTADASRIVRLGDATAPLCIRRAAFMRYYGQGHEIEIDLPSDPLRPADLTTLQSAFEAAYRTQFSRPVPGMEIEIMNWAVAVQAAPPNQTVSSGIDAPTQSKAPAPQTRRFYCAAAEAQVDGALYARADLPPDRRINGPALIQEAQTTTLVGTGWQARADKDGNLWLTRRAEGQE